MPTFRASDWDRSSFGQLCWWSSRRRLLLVKSCLQSSTVVMSCVAAVAEKRWLKDVKVDGEVSDSLLLLLSSHWEKRRQVDSMKKACRHSCLHCHLSKGALQSLQWQGHLETRLSLKSIHQRSIATSLTKMPIWWWQVLHWKRELQCFRAVGLLFPSHFVKKATAAANVLKIELFSIIYPELSFMFSSRTDIAYSACRLLLKTSRLLLDILWGFLWGTQYMANCSHFLVLRSASSFLVFHNFSVPSASADVFVLHELSLEFCINVTRNSSPNKVSSKQMYTHEYTQTVHKNNWIFSQKERRGPTFTESHEREDFLNDLPAFYDRVVGRLQSWAQIKESANLSNPILSWKSTCKSLSQFEVKNCKKKTERQRMMNETPTDSKATWHCHWNWFFKLWLLRLLQKLYNFPHKRLERRQIFVANNWIDDVKYIPSALLEKMNFAWNSVAVTGASH